MATNIIVVAISRISRWTILLMLTALVFPVVSAGPANADDLGHYCSMTWPNGDWALRYYAMPAKDPCGELMTETPGGTIQRAGLFSAAGVNNVVARCGNGGYVIFFQGNGMGPLNAAYDRAHNKDHQMNCIFTAAPRELPLFSSPFPLGSPGYSLNNGVDHERGCYTAPGPCIHRDFLPADFGYPGGYATVMDWMGRPRYTWIEDHTGYDLGLTLGNAINAVADGVVQEARARPVFHDPKNPNACPGTVPTQNEIYIKHTISGLTGTVVLPGSGLQATAYDETIITYYAHMDTIKTGLKAGDVVSKGVKIGTAGTTGCSSAVHLHFSTYKISNSVGHRSFPWQINSIPADGKAGSDNMFSVLIDPSGFYAPKGFDPWAWNSFPDGALSINLWEPGMQPPGN